MDVSVLFFELDGTLCLPTVPFPEVFLRCTAPLLAQVPHGTRRDLLAAWTAALLLPGPSTTAGCLARAPAACGLPDPGSNTAGSLAANLNAEWAAAQQVLPGVLNLLSDLGARWPLGLISNGPSDAQRAVIAHLDLESHFDWIVISGDPDVGVRKPDPRIFTQAVARAGVPPAASLYVGDSAVNDVAGAASAGLRTCWVNPSGQSLPVEVPLPDMQIRSVVDVARALRSS